jgi:translocation and assembly module TamA
MLLKYKGQFLLVLILVCYVLPVSGWSLSVEVRGLDSQLEENVLAYLSIEQEASRETLNEARLQRLHQRAETEIRKALRPFGFFKPVITSSLTRNEEEDYVASYIIQPGPPIRLAKVDFQVMGEGADDPAITQAFTMKPEQVLDQSVYEKAKQGLLSDAIERGYLDARYTQHQIKVDMKHYHATIILHLNTGMRLRFGEVRFNQKKEAMDPEFLARYVTFRPGDPFSQEALLDLQGQLLDSEYFKRVEVVSRRDATEGDQVPIDVNLRRNKSNRYRIGLGYSTDTGPRLKLDWKDRRIGRKGHRMRSEFLISERIGMLSNEYLIPLERPTVDYIRIGTSFERFNTETNQGKRALLDATHSVSLDRGWRRSLGLEYIYEDFKVSEQEDTARLLVPSIDWLRIKSDQQARILKGKRLNFRIEGAAESLLSSTSYLSLFSGAKFIQGLGESDWRLLSRLELGATWADEFEKLPPSKRFFAGGDNTVRGFGYQELGPEDAAGDVVGGRYLAIGGLELDHPIQGKWSGAAFADVGNAFDSHYHSESAYGIGLGLRWASPVGPVRIDLASGVHADERHWRIHIVVGPEI